MPDLVTGYTHLQLLTESACYTKGYKEYDCNRMNTRLSRAKLKIFAAVFVGTFLVGGSFYLKAQREPMAVASNTESAPTLGVRKYIPVVDSNLDGVPDWQAELVEGEPIFVDASSTEPYVPPDTVSGQFVYKFNQDVTTLDVYGLLDEHRADLIEASVKHIEKETMEEIYTEADLTSIVATTDKEALKAYGNLVAGTFYTFLVSEETEYEIFDRMTADGNPKHIEKLKVIEGQYDKMITYLLNMQVPEQYVFEHLAIVNGLSAMRENVYGMQLLFDDPYYTAGRYRRFIEDFLVMKNAVSSLYDALYLDEKIVFTDQDNLRVLMNDLQ